MKNIYERAKVIEAMIFITKHAYGYSKLPYFSFEASKALNDCEFSNMLDGFLQLCSEWRGIAGMHLVIDHVDSYYREDSEEIEETLDNKQTVTDINSKERAKAVRAFETICRTVNNEDHIMYWLMVGVADGDITSTTTDSDLEYYYLEDDDFRELIRDFLTVMIKAYDDGGLYVDGVVSMSITEYQKYQERKTRRANLR